MLLPHVLLCMTLFSKIRGMKNAKETQFTLMNRVVKCKQFYGIGKLPKVIFKHVGVVKCKGNKIV